MTIRIMAPDLPSPSGGMKVIYNYVEHLIALGHDARVWHGTPGFRYPNWSSTAPVDTGHELPFATGDLIVMPETGGGKWSFLNPEAPHVMLCQGMDFVFADASFLHDVPGDYPGWPQATATLGVSEAIVSFLERACAPGFAIHHVPVEISGDFAPSAKEKRIALMPRRREVDLLGAVQLIRRSGKLGDWKVVLIEGMTSAQVAEELSRSALFLFGAEREGFGLPGAEAMAAGCHVIGFTGDGAKEYLRPDTGSVILDSDVVGMRDAALASMRLFETDRDTWQTQVDRGTSVVRARYSPNAVRSALEAAFASLTAPGSSSTIPQDMILSHYMTASPQGGLFPTAYREARTVAGRVKRALRRS